MVVQADGPDAEEDAPHEDVEEPPQVWQAVVEEDTLERGHEVIHRID